MENKLDLSRKLNTLIKPSVIGEPSFYMKILRFRMMEIKGSLSEIYNLLLRLHSVYLFIFGD